MKTASSQRGFTVIEVLVSTLLFAMLMIGVTQLYSRAMDLQRRGAGYLKIQENAMFIMESIAREIRVSTIGGAAGCSASISVTHPVNGGVVYAYSQVGGRGIITRSVGGAPAEQITSSEVDVSALSFCRSGVTPGDNTQARVTIPITMKASAGKADETVEISLQTTIVSRDLISDLTD